MEHAPPEKGPEKVPEKAMFAAALFGESIPQRRKAL
jgi:hypothetical protein